MYGTTAGTAAGTLAYTGFETGSWILVGAALLMAGVTLFQLARRGKKVRP